MVKFLPNLVTLVGWQNCHRQQFCAMKPPALLALATLGEAIRTERILSELPYPRWPRQVLSLVTAAGIIALKVCLHYGKIRYKLVHRGKYHSNVDLLFDRFGISCITSDHFCFYLQNRIIQTGQTGGQWYSDTSHFSIPWPCNYTRNKTRLN